MPAVATQEYSDDLGNWDSPTVDAATETRTHHPACERSEQTGREARRASPAGTRRHRRAQRVNELTSYTPSGGSAISLTYGDAGNSACERSEQTSREPGGRVPSWPVVFGQAGCNAEGGHNLTQDGSADDDHKYTWDYRNRLYRGLPTSGSSEFGGDRQTRISEGREPRRGDSWNTTAEYKYDALNRRVLKVVTNKGDLNGTTRFLWGGESNWQCLEERDSSDDLVARYTYSPDYIDAVAVQERDLNADDDFGDDDEVVYYLSNTLHSVYALVDADENVIERYRYDAYGACTVLDADGSADADGLSDVENPYTFTGRRLDTESGLMQYRHRYYSATMGRFVARDPVLNLVDMNRYSYASSWVTLAGDPSGLLPRLGGGTCDFVRYEKRVELPLPAFLRGKIEKYLKLGYTERFEIKQCAIKCDDCSDGMEVTTTRQRYGGATLSFPMKVPCPGVPGAMVGFEPYLGLVAFGLTRMKTNSCDSWWPSGTGCLGVRLTLGAKVCYSSVADLVSLCVNGQYRWEWSQCLDAPNKRCEGGRITIEPCIKVGDFYTRCAVGTLLDNPARCVYR